MKLRNLAVAVFASVGLLGSSVHAAIIDLGFSLDGSGSISSSEFNTMRTGLSTALGSIPTTGTNQYRLAVTSYGGSGVTTVVPPTIVTAQNIGDLQTDVANATKPGGGTPTALAITATFDLFNDLGLGQTTILNISTDGFPNSQSASETAALNAHNSGLDGLGFEAIGSNFDIDDMARIAGLGTAGDASNGVALNVGDTIPNTTTTGFALPVSDFTGYQAAISAKVQRVVDDTTNPVPLPAAAWLMIAALGGLFSLRRRSVA